jgi:hypothetical protein
MFLAFQQKRYAKRLVRQLLKSYAIVSNEDPALAGEHLYREVLLRSKLVDAAQVDEVLWQADDSIDEWTTHANTELGFRAVVHFVLLSHFQSGDDLGPVVSFKNIVYSLVAADL